MLCIASAITFETEKLVKRIGAKKGGNEAIWLSPHPDLLITITGVGYLASAIRLMQVLHRFPAIDRLIFTGSAGVYPGVSVIRPGDLCSCRHTVLGDGAAELQLSQYARPLPRQAIPSTFPIPGQLYSATVATLLSLTASDTLAASLNINLQAELENMELYGVAEVCRQKSVAWNAVLGVTNRVGKDGHQEWQENYRILADKTGSYLFDLLTTTE